VVNVGLERFVAVVELVDADQNVRDLLGQVLKRLQLCFRSGIFATYDP
jgi:hypothetical protein